MPPVRRGGLQEIPRPADARAGGAAPWADRPATRNITLADVRRAFAEGARAVRRPRRVPTRSAAERPAAVLCSLFEEAGEAHVILTRRSSMMRSHTGQVSFPGGRLDDGEAPLAAALREASEEVGIDPGAVEVLGQLSPLATISGQVLITPFVGVLPARPTLRPSPAEVERAFDVSLRELVSGDVYREELWRIPDVGWRSVSFFELEGDTVWGATAWMLRELLELVVVPPSAGEDGDRNRRHDEGGEE